MKNILSKLKSFIGQPVITKRREPSFKELLESGTDVEISNYIVSKAHLLGQIYPDDIKMFKSKIRQFFPYITALTHLREKDKVDLTIDVLIGNLSMLKYFDLSKNELVPIGIREKLTTFLMETPAYMRWQEANDGANDTNKHIHQLTYEHWRHRVYEISEIILLIKKGEDL